MFSIALNFHTENIVFRNFLSLKQKLKKYIIVLLIPFFFNCAGKNSGARQNSNNFEYLAKQGKIFWEQRIDSTAMKKSEALINRAFEKQPYNFEISVLISEMKYTRAYFYENSLNNKKIMFYDGSEICKKAVINHPEFSKVYNLTKGDSTFRLLSALADAPKSVVPALYWWAINLAHYLNNKPVLERINQRELMEVIMHRVLTFEPDFHFSGPYRFFGLLYTRIPGLDLSQSKTYFNQSLSANPEYLGNSVLMAEFYYQKAGDREQFNRILNEVVQTDLNKYPELITYNFFFQNKARTLLENESSLFE
tara:strand:+ start:3229 stop:4152 length:924 start_codon:yes stop_codon:yes gene_type:complete